MASEVSADFLVLVEIHSSRSTGSIFEAAEVVPGSTAAAGVPESTVEVIPEEDGEVGMIILRIKLLTTRKVTEQKGGTTEH